MDLFQSHCDLVSLIIALSVSSSPCQSPVPLLQSHPDLVSLSSTLSVSSGLVAISLWPCQSHHCLVSLTLVLSLYHVSVQSLCRNLTVTLSVSPWRWLFWTWMTWLPSAFGPWASSTAPSGSCLSLPPRWGSPCPSARCAASCEPPPWCDLQHKTIIFSKSTYKQCILVFVNSLS